MFYIIAFILGSIWGSFANVCIHRLPNDESMAIKRSYCPKCSTKINWFDNIPLLSFFLLGGKCRSCKVKIDKRGATSIDLSSVTYNSESSNTRSSDTLLQNKNKRKTSIFTKLDTNLQGENITQRRFKNYSQSGVNTIIDFIFDKLRIQERIQDSKNAAKELNDYVRFLQCHFIDSLTNW